MGSNQLNIKQLEMAKIRITKILKNYPAFTKYTKALTTYPAIAAINSKLAGTSPEIIDIASSVSLATVAELFTPTSTTLPINSLIQLHDNDPALFSVVTSKAYMLALTNAGTSSYTAASHPVAWDSVAVDGYPYAVRDVVGTQTTNIDALQAYVNYLAAAEIKSPGRISYALDVVDVAAANPDPAVVGPGYTTIAYDNTYYLLFKCILGLLSQSQTCPTGGQYWTNKAAASSFLTLNYLAGNLTLDNTVDANADDTCPGCTTDSGASFSNVKADYTVASFINDASTRLTTHITELNGLITSVTGKWDAFDSTHTVIRDKVGGRDKFLSVYNKLDFTRAVKANEYNALLPSVSSINGYSYLDQIWNDSFIMKLINGGIAKFSEANTDVSDYTKNYMKKAGFKLWGDHMPLPSTTTNTAFGTHKDDVWFYTAANDAFWSKLISANPIFPNLFAIATSTASDAGTGWYGTGTGGGSATSDNFNAKLATKAAMQTYLKAGVSPNFFCAGANTDCVTSYTAGTVVQSATVAAPEYNNVLDCLLSDEIVSIFNSPSFYLWQSPDALLTDAYSYLCGADA